MRRVTFSSAGAWAAVSAAGAAGAAQAVNIIIMAMTTSIGGYSLRRVLIDGPPLGELTRRLELERYLLALRKLQPVQPLHGIRHICTGFDYKTILAVLAQNRNRRISGSS